MVILKVAGIVVGAWLVLGFGFIEPAKQMGESGWVMILVGIAIVTSVAYLLVRKVIRTRPRGEVRR